MENLMLKKAPAKRHRRSRPTEGNSAQSLTAALLRLLMLEFRDTAQATSVTTCATGRNIRVEIVDHRGCHPATGHMSDAKGFGKITIEHSRVKFDDAPWTAIPKGVRVKISVAKAKLLLDVGSRRQRTTR